MTATMEPQLPVLESRAVACLRAYGFTNDVLTTDEMAFEIVDAVLPAAGAEFADSPVWWGVVDSLGVCTNCMCTECACCVGCGGVDADVFGSHGYWCAL